MPARRFFALIADMKRLHTEKAAENYLYMCDVVMRPHVTKDSQQKIINKFYTMARPHHNRANKALDPKKDYDVIGAHLKGVFTQKARLH